MYCNGKYFLFIGFSPGNNLTSAFYIGDYSSVYFLVSKMLTFYLFFSHLPFSFYLHWVFVAAPGLSPVAVSGGCFPVVGHGLLIAVASPVAEVGSRVQAQEF